MTINEKLKKIICAVGGFIGGIVAFILGDNLLHHRRADGCTGAELSGAGESVDGASESVDGCSDKLDSMQSTIDGMQSTIGDSAAILEQIKQQKLSDNSGISN